MHKYYNGYEGNLLVLLHLACGPRIRAAVRVVLEKREKNKYTEIFPLFCHGELLSCPSGNEWELRCFQWGYVF